MGNWHWWSTKLAEALDPGRSPPWALCWPSPFPHSCYAAFYDTIAMPQPRPYRFLPPLRTRHRYRDRNLFPMNEQLIRCTGWSFTVGVSSYYFPDSHELLLFSSPAGQYHLLLCHLEMETKCANILTELGPRSVTDYCCPRYGQGWLLFSVRRSTVF